MASLIEAVRNNNIRLVKVYLTVPKALPPRDLHLALLLSSQLGHVEVLQVLLEAGVEVKETRDSNNNTPLYLAITCNQPETARLLASVAKEVIDERGGGRNSPLHEAARLGHTECLHVLLQHGAYLDSRDSMRCTPLILAVKHKHYNSVKALLEAGCSVNLKDSAGCTALHYACQHGHSATALPLLLAAGADINLQDLEGSTPILMAAAEGLTHVVRALVATGRCDVNLSLHSSRRTALHLLAYKGHADCLSDLIAAGADINMYDAELRTALWYAVSNRRVEVVKLLLKANSQVDMFRCPSHVPPSACPTRLAVEKRLVPVTKLFILTGYDSEHLRDCLSQPDMAQIFTEVGESHWLHLACTVMSLRNTCRKWIRHYLGCPVYQRVQQLPLPPALRDFLFLAELDDDHD